MPADLIREIDELVGLRNRSRFVTEAVERKLRHERLKRALDTFHIADGEVPEWETAESTREWLRELRRSGERFPAGRDWSS